MASVNIDIFKGEIMFCKQQQKKKIQMIMFAKSDIIKKSDFFYWQHIIHICGGLSPKPQKN